MTSILTIFSILNVLKMFVAFKRAASGVPNPTPFYILLLAGKVRFSHAQDQIVTTRLAVIATGTKLVRLLYGSWS